MQWWLCTRSNISSNHNHSSNYQKQCPSIIYFQYRIFQFYKYVCIYVDYLKSYRTDVARMKREKSALASLWFFKKKKYFILHNNQPTTYFLNINCKRIGYLSYNLKKYSRVFKRYLEIKISWQISWRHQCLTVSLIW